MATTREHHGRGVCSSVALALLIAFVTGSTATTFQNQKTLPLVVIIATGGTIANTQAGRIPVNSVLKEVPQIADVARIEVVDYIRVPSQHLTIKNELVRRVWLSSRAPAAGEGGFRAAPTGSVRTT